MKRFLKLSFPFGSIYKVPLSAVIEHRARTLAKRAQEHDYRDYKLTYQEEHARGQHDDDELVRWAREEMTWRDVADRALPLFLFEEDPETEWGVVRMTVFTLDAQGRMV